MRFSLKEFLIIAGVASLGTGSLAYSNDLLLNIWLVVLLVSAIVLTIHASLTSGAPRAFAIGCLCAGAWYAGMVKLSPGALTLYSGSTLATSQALYYPLMWIVGQRNHWVDHNGNRYSEKPAGAVEDTPFGGGGGAFGGTVTPSPELVKVRYVQVVNQETFMVLGHCLWTLFIAYLGGKYAVWVYLRQPKGPNVLKV